jgi:hypothetical protein
LFHHLCYDLPVSERLANIDWACWAIGISAFVFEATFWVVLAVPQLSNIYAMAGIGFHLSTLWLMRIDYLTYHGPTYWVFAVAPLAQVLGVHIKPS